MQKKIIALAIAAAFAAPAVAMADVSMYGSMDGGLRHQMNDSTSIITDTMQMGQWNTARFGFKGTDDLGDGMKAVVVLETSLAPGNVGSSTVITSGTRANTVTGTVTSPTATGWDYNSNNPFGLLFDRQATVGLVSGMGQFDLGWQNQLGMSTVASFDPMQGKVLGVTGVAAMSLTGATRAGTALASTKFGDVKVSFEHQVANADKANAPKQGFANTVAASYAAGDINAAAAYGVGSATPAAVQPVDKDNGVTYLAAGAGYKMDDIKLSAGYVSRTTKDIGSNKTDVTMFAGVAYAMSNKIGLTGAYYTQTTNAGSATATAALDNTSKRMIVSSTYSLSKATTAYFEIDKVTTNAGGAAVDAVTNGIGMGLNTSF